MIRAWSIIVLIAVVVAGQPRAQERGVQFGFAPEVTDTIAGSALLLELLAVDEDGTVLTNWDQTGFPVNIIVHNTTANTDTSERSWSADKYGYSFSAIFDAYGNEFIHTTPNKFYIPNTKFVNGRLQVAFSHTKAEDSIYLEIDPQMASPGKQFTPFYLYSPAEISNYLVEITSPGAQENTVYLARPYEVEVTPRDAYMNTVPGVFPVNFTARFPGEFTSSSIALEEVEGPTPMQVTSTVTRMYGIHHLQYIMAYNPQQSDVSGRSTPYQILTHEPNPFHLIAPGHGDEISLGNESEILSFEWEVANDPYSNMLVSKHTGERLSDSVLYVVTFSDYNNLAKTVSFKADNDGYETTLRLTHGQIAEVARTLHGDSTTRLNALWSVMATDGLTETMSTSSFSESERNNALYADLLTLDASPAEAAVAGIHLAQNYPNPFNPSTSVSYTVPERTLVRLQVFDMYGTLLSTLVDSQQEAGVHTVIWDGMTDGGCPVPSGSYLLQMHTGGIVQTRIMCCIK